MSYVQSYYPLEYRTPPLPLVALIGGSEFHKDISDFFVHQLRPPLVSLHSTAEVTDQFIARNFGPAKQRTGVAAASSSSIGAPVGIIKGDWLSKHRGRKAVVAVVVVTRNEVEGDPSSWARMLQLLRMVRDQAVTQYGAAMLVAVVQGVDAGELPAERISGVCQNLSLDPRLLLPIVPRVPAGTDEAGRGKREASLRQLGQLVHEQCAAVYSRLAAGVTVKLSERLGSDPELRAQPAGALELGLGIRADFKLASYAEFRQEWKQAVVYYQGAYSQVKQAVGALGQGPKPPQRWSELAKSGELLHLKLLMLLMHQNRLDEACVQAQQHLALFSLPSSASPAALPAAAMCSHLAFMVRQHQVIVELMCPKIESSLAAGQALGQAARELSRSLLLLTAAELAVQRRKLCDALQAAHRQQQALGPGSRPTPPVPLVRRGVYLGQLVVRAAGAGVGAAASAPGRALTDAEYIAYLEGEEAGMGQPQQPAASASASHTPAAPRTVADPVAGSLEVLNSALLSLQPSSSGGGGGGAARRPSGASGAGAGAGGGSSERMRARLTLMLAVEHLTAGHSSAARKLALQACHVYRREGWVPQLTQSLELLKELAGKLRLFQEQALYTLELAALSTAHQGERGERGGPAASASSSSAAASCQLLLQALDRGSPDAAAAAPSSPLDPSSPSSSSPQALSPSSSRALPREYNYLVDAGDGHGPFAVPSPARARQQQAGPGAGAGAAPTAASKEDSEGATGTSYLRCQQDFGWWRCVCLAAGSSQLSPGSDTLDLHVALWNLLPSTLELRGGMFLTLEDDEGTWDVALQPDPGPSNGVGSPAAAISPDVADSRAGRSRSRSNGQQPAHGAVKPKPLAPGFGVGGLGSRPVAPPGVQPLALQPGRWEHTCVTLVPRCAGKLHILRVVLLLSDHTSITFNVRSFPSPAPPLACPSTLGDLGTQLGLPQPFPGSRNKKLPGSSRVVPGAWQLSLPHLGPLPTVSIAIAPVLLVGEQASVCISVLNPGRELEGGIVEFAVKLGPGLSAADVSLTVETQGHLASLPLDGQGRVTLPVLQAGGTRHQVQAWIRADRAGKVSLTALLLCPSPLPSTVELVFEEPFQYRCHLGSEAGVYTLTPPPPRISGADVGVTPVTIGQQLLVQVWVRSMQAADLELCNAKLLSNREAGFMPLAELSSQIQSWPIPFGPGDVQALVLPLCPTRTADTAVPLGKLQLMWRRAPTLGKGRSGSGSGPEPQGGREGPGLQQEAIVTTLMELPQVSVGDSLMTVRTLGPAQLTAGIAFTYSLQIQNFSHHAVELSVSLQDSPGFVLSGERVQTLSVAAKECSTVMWLLVAHAAGNLKLPPVRLLAPRLNSALLTQSSEVHVLPF